MKKINILFLTVLMIASCSEKHSEEYITLAGKLENNKDSLITIYSPLKKIKTMAIDADGTFKDTLKVEKAAVYTFQTSRTNRAPIYLKNGYDLKLYGNADEFITSFTFEGKGAANSNFVIAQITQSQKNGSPATILALEQEAFEKKINAMTQSFDSILGSYKDLDSSLVAMSNQQNQQMAAFFRDTYKSNLAMGKGKASPKFTDYIDSKGGTKSLDSFKGKYVYIDIWATWCGPCIVEIPYLQKLEKEYHNKNIEFVSISTDNPNKSGGSWEAAEKKWRNFVESKQMSGVQLWSGKDNSFQQAYRITGIPRFILIDPQGNIVNANAPRPSNKDLKTLFTSLGI
ncbi:MAG: TlpA family protein disulfide reductase [Polaribacter sp.]